MNDNPKWLVGSWAKSRCTDKEYKVDAIFGDDIYRLVGLGPISGENLNKHFIMSRVANRPPNLFGQDLSQKEIVEKAIKEVVKEILSQYSSGDFCGCYEGDICNVYPATIESLENKLVAGIVSAICPPRGY